MPRRAPLPHRFLGPEYLRCNESPIQGAPVVRWFDCSLTLFGRPAKVSRLARLTSPVSRVMKTPQSCARQLALGFGLNHCVRLEDLNAPLPPPLDPLTVLAHLPRQHLTPMDLASWRCGRAQPATEAWPTGGAVLMVDPDGKLAGLAEMAAGGELRPRLVIDARG